MKLDALSRQQLDYSEDYGYDALYRLTDVVRSAGLTGLWRYGYDAVGNRLSEQKDQGVTSYSYNEKNQLLGTTGGGTMRWRGSLNEPGSVTLTSALVNGQPARILQGNVFEAEIPMASGANTVTVQATDVNGNVTTKSYSANVSGTGATYTYDANGNLATKVEGADTWAYEWNAENRLTRVLNNGTEVARYKYDPKGRRVERAAGGAVTTYTYDFEDILREATGGTPLLYVHGFGPDDPLASDQAGALTLLHADALGSVVETTNAAGTVGASGRYDGFGLPELATSGYAYTGREWDAATGLYYYRARYYDPKAGRFLSEDWIRVEQRTVGELNAFAYAGNNPGNRTDPAGLESGAAFHWLHCIDAGTCGTPPRPPGFCGSGWNEPWVPDAIGGTDFSPCCGVHDKCYERCGAPKACCDLAFGNCLDNQCRMNGRASTDPAHPTFCQLMAAQYWAAVHARGGGAYNDAQQKNCKK